MYYTQKLHFLFTLYMWKVPKFQDDHTITLTNKYDLGGSHHMHDWYKKKIIRCHRWHNLCKFHMMSQYISTTWISAMPQYLSSAKLMTCRAWVYGAMTYQMKPFSYYKWESIAWRYREKNSSKVHYMHNNQWPSRLVMLANQELNVRVPRTINIY